MSDETGYGPRPDPDLVSLFWETLRGDDNPPRPMTAEGVLAVWEIVRRAQPDAEAVREIALFARECDQEPSSLVAFLWMSPALSRSPLLSPPDPQEVLAWHALRCGREAAANDLARAERYFWWATREFHAAGMSDEESRAQVARGLAFQAQGRLNAATDCYLAAFELDVASGNQFNQGTDLGLLAEVARLARQYDGAERLARQALAIHDQFGNGLSAAGVYVALGLVEKARGHHWRAHWYFWRARRATRRERKPRRR